MFLCGAAFDLYLFFCPKGNIRFNDRESRLIYLGIIFIVSVINRSLACFVRGEKSVKLKIDRESDHRPFQIATMLLLVGVVLSIVFFERSTLPVSMVVLSIFGQTIGYYTWSGSRAGRIEICSDHIFFIESLIALLQAGKISKCTFEVSKITLKVGTGKKMLTIVENKVEDLYGVEEILREWCRKNNVPMEEKNELI